MNSGRSPISFSQARAKISRFASCQCVSFIAPAGKVGRSIGRINLHALFDIAVVGHHAARGDLHRGATGLVIDEEKRARIAQELQRAFERVTGFGRSR